MKLYFKHSNNGKPAAQINFSHFNTEDNHVYEIYTSMPEALKLIEAACEGYINISLRTLGASDYNEVGTTVIKLHLRGVIRINP